MKKVRAGIVGGSGYMGGEAIRVLLKHPNAEIAWVASRTPGPVEQSHPNLYGTGLEFVCVDDVDAPDYVFLALPAAASMEVAVRFIKAGSRIIDLGSAFRLRNKAVWERVYGQPHTAWSLMDDAVYGISELHADRFRSARLIANPGCFSSAAILAFAPLLASRLVDPATLTVAGLSGTAGAGAEFSRAIHHPEIGGNIVPYNAVGHRHSFEIEQELTAVAGQDVRVHFTSCYVPIVRGILNICRCFLNARRSRPELLDVFRDFYKDQPFIRVYDQPRDEAESWQYKPYPWVSSVAGTNFCFIGLDVDEDRQSVVVLSVLDSLGKGGAQAGIENMNIMAGFDRTAGLLDRGLHP